VVSIQENWARLTGEVLDVRPHETLPDHRVVELKVDRVDDVPPHPNMLQDAAGKTVSVAARESIPALQHLRPGQTVSLEVRRGGLTGLFAHPDNFTVL
jgi:hypothetical protein